MSQLLATCALSDDGLWLPDSAHENLLASMHITADESIRI